MTLIKKLALTIVLLNVLIFLLINLIYTDDIYLFYNGVSMENNFNKPFLAIGYPMVSIFIYYFLSHMPVYLFSSSKMVWAFKGTIAVLDNEKNRKIIQKRGKELFEQENVLIQSIILMASFQVLFQQNIPSVFVYSCLGLIMVAMVRTVYLIHKETIFS